MPAIRLPSATGWKMNHLSETHGGRCVFLGASRAPLMECPVYVFRPLFVATNRKKLQAFYEKDLPTGKQQISKKYKSKMESDYKGSIIKSDGRSKNNPCGWHNFHPNIH